MRIKFIITISCLYFSLYASGQEYSLSYGKVDLSEYELQSYSKDSEAGAIILFDIGETNFVEDLKGTLQIKLKRTVRIKILKESGIDQANISLRYYVDGYGKTENIDRIKAICYNKNGDIEQTSELNKKSIYDEKINQFWRAKRFAVPGVKVGSIFEYTFEHTTPFMFNLPDWEFQSNIPTVHSSYTVKMVPFYEYVILSQGISEYTKKESHIDNGFTRVYAGVEFKNMIHTFEIKDIPAFYDDEFITSRNDYIKKLDFQLAQINFPTGGKSEILTTWEKMVDELIKHQDFGKYISSAEKLSAKQTISELPLKSKSDQEKIEIICNYVKQNFTLNKFYGKYAMHKPKELVSDKTGSVADINLYLLGLLKAAGIISYPILLSTREHGKINKNYPFTNSFNYVVVLTEFEGKMMVLDATEPLLPYYLLPMRCLNDFGFIVKKEPRWLNLNSNFNSTITVTNVIQVKEDSLELSVFEQSSGYDAFQQRKKIKNNEDDFKKSKVSDNDIIISNINNYTSALSIKFKKNVPIDKFESDLYIKPFNSLEFIKNPLTNNKRDYPVDFIYKRKRTLVTTLFIPDYLQHKSIPLSKNFEDSLMALDYHVEDFGNTIKIQASYQLKKSIYPPDDYKLLKINFAKLNAILSQQVVLTEKK